MIDEAAVRAALSQIVDPGRGADIITGDQVKALTIKGGAVSFILEVDAARGAAMEPVRAAAERAVAALAGVERVSAIMTAHAVAGAPRTMPAADAPRPAPKPEPKTRPVAIPKPLGMTRPKNPPGVKTVIAVASGKGGVGKSTVAANLAVALAARGQKVGMLDADVYGPSQPRMLGVSGRPSSPDGNIILPHRNHGVTLMSLGLMVGEDEALAWRGPMLIGALQQMLRQVQWGRLDVLVVDLPPGTGDVQMTLCQNTDVAGAVIVSTPQDIALIDARKGIDMFKKMGTPILGVIENMSAFVCDGCGKVHHPFGHGGAKAEAARIGVPFLGEVPLDLDIRVAGDGGAPIVVLKPESPQAAAFMAVADALLASDALQAPAP
ncbi:Mrp/NBP35 family ATP-binding protein [Acuticoccus sp. I52.16.1]|uniref:Mrp/NBP35 family ATP-binding protein n=1 Tax=Acuticoccus sp. I52.16.1 TaxID=2928472 RepID=UPI001FD13F3D|nr:Mrp/NBP35 family ATP-binding protein [Acuticoccus sp. I52.16.1]UOM35273.1 Mrp/NBP35 family ATP-binding protein [Acuticoccus sp. I52.16.1]